MRRLSMPTLLLVLIAGCGDAVPLAPIPTGIHRSNLSIEDIAMDRCDTPPELVDGLSSQLVEAINCLRPGTLADIPIGGDIELLRAGRPAFVDARGLDDLLDAANAGGRTMTIRWSYRDVALQHLFWLQDQFRNCAVAAPAGLSNHQNGLAVDLNDRQAWEADMAAHGWFNDLPNDRVHFDYKRAEDVGLGALSLRAFQALWNKNFPDRELALTSELDGPTYEALSQAPVEGFALDLCAGGAPPVGPGPVRGPTVAQSAWRGCEAPPNLIEGLSEQVAQGMNCLEPGALRALNVCQDPGCVEIDAPPISEWLGAEAHAALVDVGRDRERSLVIRWALRDVALQHFFASAADNIGCPGATETARSVYNTGQAVHFRESRTLAGTLESQGFTNQDTGSETLWRFTQGQDLTALNVLAFQMLWNLNRPQDAIDDDGRIGPMTRSAIDRSPIDGFALGLCGAPPRPDAGVGPDLGLDPDVGPEPDAAPDPDDGVPQPDVAQRPDASAQDGAIDFFDARGELDAGRDAGRDAVSVPRLPPAPVRGWTAIDEEGGCNQTPAAPLWFLLLVPIRRRRT